MWKIPAVILHHRPTPDQLRAFAAQLLSQVETMGKKINRDQTVIEKLTHIIAQL